MIGRHPSLSSLTSLLSLSILVILAAAPTGCSTQRALELDLDGPETDDGLVPIVGSRAAKAWGRPGVEIADYDKLLLQQVGVEVRDVRRPPRSTSHTTQNRAYPLNDDDIHSLAAMADEVFHEELARSEGFTLVGEPGPGVINVVIGLTDVVSFFPPSQPAASRIFVNSVGEATLVLELQDATTGETLVRIADRGRAERHGTMISATAPHQAEIEVRRRLRTWARQLREGLDSL